MWSEAEIPFQQVSYLLLRVRIEWASEGDGENGVDALSYAKPSPSQLQWLLSVRCIRARIVHKYLQRAATRKYIKTELR